MGHIAIKLNPDSLPNPDADLRYDIPDLVSHATGGRVRDDGFDYADGNFMLIFLACDDPAVVVAEVVDVLRTSEVCGNQILDSAEIGISTNAKDFTIVHPPNSGRDFTVNPW